MNALNLPFAGLRDYSSYKVFSRTFFGYYWSSSLMYADKARYMYFSNSDFNWQEYNYRSDGYAVRCFKNTT